MTHGSLFSGFGGFDLAAEWMGWGNKFHCEWNDFGQNVLKYYWPDAESFTDITKTDFTKYANRIDILTGGFPCQPYSLAGKRKGKEDERHLWPEMLRAIREIQPRWVVGENVFGLINWSDGLVFHEVQTDLEAAGYEVWPYVLPACAVNAPHRRDRVWFVANSKDNRLERFWGNRKAGSVKRNIGSVCVNEGTIINDDADSGSIGRDTFSHVNGNVTNREERWEFCSTDSQYNWSEWPTQPPIRIRNDGIPPKLDGIAFSNWVRESIKAAGNAIVPQVVYQIFKTIEQYEEHIF